MKGFIIFSVLIACSLALPTARELETVDVKPRDSAAEGNTEPIADNSDPSTRNGIVAAIFGRTTTPPPADALIVYVRPGGIFRRRTTTTTTTTTTAEPTTEAAETTEAPATTVPPV